MVSQITKLWALGPAGKSVYYKRCCPWSVGVAALSFSAAMTSVLVTYGLNPLQGLKVWVKAEDASWGQVLHQAIPAVRAWVKHRPPMQISVGSLVPDHAEQLSRIQLLRRLKFFVAIETAGDLALPALPSGQQTALQVYAHQQGSERYRTQVVRFQVGRRVRRRQRTRW